MNINNNRQQYIESLNPGDRVRFVLPHGGTKSGRVVMAFATHVVVNGGGRYGTPYVVDHNNVIVRK